MVLLRLLGLLVVMSGLLVGPALRAETRDDALRAARQATNFYSEQLATHGGYLWKYSADLKLREGEGKQSAETIWVQPPGTPALGEAYVRLYNATGDKVFLNAALAAAEALRRGQLRSGGWQANIEFDPKQRASQAYRIDPVGKKQQRNLSSLDDDKTQSALRFLIQLDQALEFKNRDIHEMTEFALSGLLRAQYPNGGFPQVWNEPYDVANYPVMKAKFPRDWPRVYPGHQNYWFRYTLNDNLLPDVIETLLLAEEAYQDARFTTAIRKIGDFLILAQLPDPQPAWAQQYDFEMQPCWARKFEPPAITGG
ncbi:MAG TPA: pectate lyase, partial [Pirellulaceae bacterium]|nr:pectate lyase [Pirellulaceae bacterium]